MRHLVLSTLCVVGLAGLLGAATAPATAPGGLRGAVRDPWLYVAGYMGDDIEIYDLKRIGAPQIGRITNGIKGPCGLTLDAQGNLYVANTVGGNVAVYPPFATAPSLVMTSDLETPVSTAVNSAGDVYVTNRSNVSPSIVVYPPGATTPSHVITSPLITNIVAETFDQFDDLFFSDFNKGVSEIADDSLAPVSLGLQGMSNANGIAIDPLTGELFVGSGNFQGMSILVYASGGTTPIRRLRGTFAAFSLGNGRIGNVEYIFVPDALTETVALFRDTAKTARGNVYARGVNNACGVAFKPAGAP